MASLRPVKILQKISWRFTYLFLRLLSRVINLLPAEGADAAAQWIGGVMYVLLPSRRRVAMANLTIAFGDRIPLTEKRRITKCAFKHISVSFMEVFRIPTILKKSIEETFTITGLEHYEQALARKKGMIFIVSHIGSWEYLSFLFYLTKYECTALVKEIRNPYIFEWLKEMRRRTSLNMIHKENARKALKTMFREIAGNGIVAVLMDQWAGNDELWVDFFGRPASTTSIPARMALKTGCALVPGACIRKGPGKYELRVFPAVPVHADTDDPVSVTRRLNQSLERQVRDNPEQWIWTHKRWKGPKKYRVKE